MQGEDSRASEVTDVVLRLKRAFEAKDLEGMRAQLLRDAVINSDGKFHPVSLFFDGLKLLFEAVDQTYLDIVGVQRVEAKEAEAFGTFDIDVSWIDRRDWLEHSQKLRVSLEMVRDQKHIGKEGRPPFLIKGITVTPRLEPKVEPGRPKEDFPRDGGDLEGAGTRGFDLFSFWY